MTNLLALNAGTELVGDYRIERVLGAGGFGITYLADEVALDRRVTIKEYFPTDYAVRGASSADAVPRSQDCDGDYRWGLDRFIEEAQTLARFDHPNIVRVYRYFRANNTAYMVLNWEEGQSLKSWLKGLGRAIRQKEIDRIVAPLLDALEIVHKADYLHRDIAPDNIIIRKDGTPVLIDFGAARGEIAAHSKTVSALVKPGYSPYEQYAERSSQQGPWTDIYALGATLYHTITGKRPPDAPSRVVKDEYIPAREAALSSYRAGFLAAIDKALSINIEARPQSVAAWRGDLLAPDPPKQGWLSRGLAGKRPDKAEPLVAPQPVKAKTVAVPPPPDAPGQQGGMLDFIEGLQKKPEAAKAAATEQQQKPARDNPSTPTARAAAKAQPADKPAPVVTDLVPKSEPRKAEPPRVRPARPRRMRGEGRNWRPLVFKLLIGASVAAGAVALQDQLPRIETRGSAVVSSQSSERLELKQLKGHKSAVAALAFSEDGRTIVSGGQDATIRVWNAVSGSLQRTIELDNGPATALALQGRKALTGHTDGTIQLWDIDKAEKLATFKRNEAAIWSLTFLGEPGRFAAAAHDWSVSMWDVRGTGGPLHVFEGHESAANAVAFSQKGSWIASGSADKTIKLWSVESLSLVRTYRGHRDFVTALAFAPDGKVLASASLDGGIRVWSTASNSLRRTLSGHKGRVGGLAFSPAGDLLASGGEDGIVKLWDFKSGRAVRLLAGHSGPVKSLAFAADGRRVATASDDTTIRTWDAVVPKKEREKERD